MSGGLGDSGFPEPWPGGSFLAGEVAGAPEVPAGDGAERTPLFSSPLDLVDGREHGGVERFGFGQAEEGESEAFADAVVGDGQNVGAAEAEDEEHLHRPSADAADLGKAFDDFFVGHAADLNQGGNGAVEGFGSEVAQGFGFGGGETGGAEHIVGSLQQMFGRGVKFAKAGEQAFEDGGGGFAVELLVDDRLEERFERGVLAFEFEGEGPGAIDELAEFGVGCGEFAAGAGGIVANGAASIGHEQQGTGSSR